MASIILEGFDGRKVAKLIQSPKRYFVSGIVVCGYSAEDESTAVTLRHDPGRSFPFVAYDNCKDSMVFEEKFNRPFEGIPAFKRGV